MWWRSVRYPFEWWKKNHRSTDAYRRRIGQTVGRPNLVPGRSYARTSGSLLSLTTFESPSAFELEGKRGEALSRSILVNTLISSSPSSLSPRRERRSAPGRRAESLILVRVGWQRMLGLDLSMIFRSRYESISVLAFLFLLFTKPFYARRHGRETLIPFFSLDD